MQIIDLSALELGTMIRERKISCSEALEETLRFIAVNEPQVHAYTGIFREQAQQRAQLVQAQIDAGQLQSPLAGVPMAVKDNISTKGLKTTCSSRMLANYEPIFDATVIERLQAQGAVMIGKCNLDEFAMGASTETSAQGITRNPWDLERVPGGSSGGSAAAVAANEAFYSLGSDTGGSIRQPCAFCNTSGIKPTYGAVSRFGLIAYASSLDQIGPIGRDIRDCAAVLAAIAGADPYDKTVILDAPFCFEHCFDGEIKGMKIGLPRQYFGQGLDVEIGEQVLAAARIFERLGATVEYFDLEQYAPIMDAAIAAYYVIACAEASSNLSRYDGVLYGYQAEADNIMATYSNSRSQAFGAEVKRRILLGSFVLSSGYYDAYYNKAVTVRNMIKQSFNQFFNQYDFILAPVAPTVAYPINDNITDPLKMYLGDVYTVAVNLAGLPAVAIPCGFSQQGLPIGMQLIGQSFAEPTLITAAHAFQLNTDYHQHRKGRVSS